MKTLNLKVINSMIVSFILLVFFACSSDSPSDEPDPDPITYTLTVNKSSIDFESGVNSLDIKVTTNVDTWVISSSGTSWITLSETTGTKGETTVTISATENIETTERTATITVNANNVNAVKIPVTQVGATVVIADFNIPDDITGMSSTAVELAAKISLGWNIGNTLEATGGETSWGNPKVTKELIDLVKQSGFNAVRIPVSWDKHLSNSNTSEIDTEWLDRVKEVVQYCIDNGMYALVNVHWDGGWLENNVTEDKKDEVNAKQKIFWEQIAVRLRDFDEHLLFASANEPAVEDATGMAVLNSYHQTFIDAVRSTGGKNAYRTLVVQGPTTDIEKTNNLMNTLPIDVVADRMMVEVHYYTPWQFAGLEEDDSWGNMAYYWGADYHSTTDTERNATWGEESSVDANFALMKAKFVDKGIPVILGEFGAIRRTTLTGDDLTLHLNSRAYYLKYVVKQAKANGLLPFYWDEGNLENKGFGIFDRSDNTVSDTQALDALVAGVQ